MRTAKELAHRATNVGLHGRLLVLESKDPSELYVLDNQHKDVRLVIQVSFLVMVSKSKETTSPGTIALIRSGFEWKCLLCNLACL